MIERFTLKIPVPLFAECVEEFMRHNFNMPGDAPSHLTKDQAVVLARIAADLYAPQMQVNWGAHRVETNRG